MILKVHKKCTKQCREKSTIKPEAQEGNRWNKTKLLPSESFFNKVNRKKEKENVNLEIKRVLQKTELIQIRKR